VAGDSSAVNLLIEACFPLILSRVSHAIKLNPDLERLRDDMIGNAALACTEFANKACKSSDDISACIVAIIHRAFQRIADETSLVGPAGVTIRAHRAKVRAAKAAGENPPKLHRPAIRSLNTDLAARRKSNRLYDSTLDDFDQILDDDEAREDVIATALEVCQSDLERQVVQLRADKRSDREIADELDVSRSTVQATRATLARRYQDHCLATGA
jgi:hypothetical protein